jgi:hypothetical protein
VQKFLEQTIGNRRGMWTTVVLAFALAAGLILLPTSTAQEAGSNRTAGYVLLGCGALVLIAAIIFEIRRWPFTRSEMMAARRAKAALATGRALPLPPMPKKLSQLQTERRPEVERYARTLVGIPWGERVTIAGAEVRPLFDRTVTFVRRVPGDWSKFSEPIGVFAHMPAPWCYIGAAEVMQRLSFHVGGVFSPVGLRQGLRFIAQAQAVEPDNPDALLTRARLLASTSDPRWLRMAEDTLGRLQAIAPDHPRLPLTEANFFRRYGQNEKALYCIERAIAIATDPVEQVIARAGKADLLANMGRWEESAQEYRTLLQTDDKDPWFWHNLSIDLYRLERYGEALECNQRALSIMPFNAAFSFGETIRKKLATANAQGN